MIDIPLVSIILPVYNAEKHLLECLNSIVDQTFKNWELMYPLKQVRLAC
jgi:glycosyltransferase involved in cell wall biosynthesis